MDVFDDVGLIVLKIASLIKIRPFDLIATGCCAFANTHNNAKNENIRILHYIRHYYLDRFY